MLYSGAGDTGLKWPSRTSKEFWKEEWSPEGWWKCSKEMRVLEARRNEMQSRTWDMAMVASTQTAGEKAAVDEAEESSWGQGLLAWSPVIRSFLRTVFWSCRLWLRKLQAGPLPFVSKILSVAFSQALATFSTCKGTKWICSSFSPPFPHLYLIHLIHCTSFVGQLINPDFFSNAFLPKLSSVLCS